MDKLNYNNKKHVIILSIIGILLTAVFIFKQELFSQISSPAKNNLEKTMWRIDNRELFQSKVKQKIFFGSDGS